ncbi:inositol-tetrakisphosphate 1-kinase 1-like [Momordica charantia]|uniref:Inositol-tetrakisphosphate 1-kinase n=1 Tax=Momordica charantia TaxID=3673 RepID=A0A6J1D5T6_MOMCH|nr:inositol-tetrakisphosphate 1-kinase 1-like [Momordica charantia]
MASPPRFRIGYAFSPKKEQTFILPSLVDYAKLHGIDLVRIDPRLPLLHQSPFHCIIHKLYDQSWVQQLRDFASLYPDVVVIDPPDQISRLLHRDSMLQVVNQITIPHGDERIEAPRQVVLHDLDVVAKDGLHAFRDLGLKFPVIAKPLEADGSSKSHDMCLVANDSGLKRLSAPIVLQEFVNHGGVVFKVYVVGECVVCVTRKSLPDIAEEELEKLEPVSNFSRISNSAAPGYGETESFGGNGEGNVEMPSLNFVMNVAAGLREAMGLTLFNFDLIRDSRDQNRYLVIDINYLPGYAKMPNYEPFLTKFFLDVVHKRTAGGDSNSSYVNENEVVFC